MTDPTDDDAAVWHFNATQTELDALEVRLVDLERNVNTIQQNVDTMKQSLTAFHHDLKNRVYPRLDRIDNELEIDEPDNLLGDA